jgi:hypothetical protein
MPCQPIARCRSASLTFELVGLDCSCPSARPGHTVSDVLAGDDLSMAPVVAAAGNRLGARGHSSAGGRVMGDVLIDGEGSGSSATVRRKPPGQQYEAGVKESSPDQHSPRRSGRHCGQCQSGRFRRLGIRPAARRSRSGTLLVLRSAAWRQAASRGKRRGSPFAGSPGPNAADRSGPRSGRRRRRRRATGVLSSRASPRSRTLDQEPDRIPPPGRKRRGLPRRSISRALEGRA